MTQTVRAWWPRASPPGQFKPCDEQMAAVSVIGLCNWVAWCFEPEGALSAQDVADQMVRHAVDMLATKDAGEVLPGPQSALETIRRNLDYLEQALPQER